MHKRYISYLLLFTIVLTVSPANKTDLNIFAAHVSRIQNNSFGDFRDIEKKEKQYILGVTAYTAQSTNGSELAKAFYPIAGTAPTVGPSIANPTIINNRLLHKNTGMSNALAGTVMFDPKQSINGIAAHYSQRIIGFDEIFWLRISVPFCSIHNNLNLQIHNATPGLDSKENISLEDLLTGKSITRESPKNAQTSLCQALMHSNRKTGIGNPYVTMSWVIEADAFEYLQPFIGVTMATPAGKNNKYFWNARCGRDKWDVHTGIEWYTFLWKENGRALSSFSSFACHYLFANSEIRTPGLRDANRKIQPLGPYYLIGTYGKKGLQPAANVITQDIKIKDQHTIHIAQSFALTKKKSILALRYDGNWISSERASLKNWCCNTYGLTKSEYPSDVVFTRGRDELFTLNAQNLSTESLATQGQFTHTVSSFFQYIFTVASNPVVLEIGGAYTWPSHNSSVPEGYTIWNALNFIF